MPLPKKLTDDQVRYVRTSPKSSVQLADELPLDRRAIDRARRRETYKDVLDASPSAAGPAALPLKDYVAGDGLKLMGRLPDGYAQTIVAAPPMFRPPHSSRSQVEKARSLYVERQRSIIREGRRIAGPNGVLLYVHRYDLMADLLDVGPGGASAFPLEQVIVWDPMIKADPRSVSTRRIPGHYRAIYVFAGNRWSIPPQIRGAVADWSTVWRIRSRLREDGTLEFPEQLADHCISMGSGRVLDPFAGVGVIGLAAARKNREWILFGNSPAEQRTFRQSLQAFYHERAFPAAVQSVGPRRQSRSAGKGRSRPAPPNMQPLF